MASTVARMTKNELQKMIEAAVEAALDQKLTEIFGDPDAGLELRRAVRERLRRQQQAVAAGERGRPFAKVVRELRLD